MTLALHQRSFKKHAYTTTAEHMPQGHQRYLEQKGWDADYFLLQAEKMGSSTLAYMRAMLESKRFTVDLLSLTGGNLMGRFK